MIEVDIASWINDPVKKRFLAKIKTPLTDEACWEWAGSKSGSNKYGYIMLGSKNTRAHRIMLHWTSAFDLKSKLEAAHKCDVPSCVNPNHLFLATHSENIKDCASKGRHNFNHGKRIIKTHCRNGHEYSENNTKLHKRLGRVCLVCRQEQRARYNIFRKKRRLNDKR